MPSVAIKVFRLDITPEQAAELAAQLGMLAGANLAHPSIVAPFDAGLEGTVPFLAEDYVAAESLDAAIRQYGPPPVAQALRILAAVAGALDFAGAVGVHHGALHPRDLLVTPDDARLTGLGIGRALEAIGLRAPMRRPYVAPERAQREGWDGRADVFSLGVLVREMLVGRPRADSGGDSRLPDEQSERLKPVLGRATAARPADRYSTCLELIAAVQDALAGGSSRAIAAPSHDLLLPLEAEAKKEGDEPAGPVAVPPLPDLDLAHVERVPEGVTEGLAQPPAPGEEPAGRFADVFERGPEAVEAAPAERIDAKAEGDLLRAPEGGEAEAPAAATGVIMAEERPRRFRGRALAAMLLVGLVAGVVGGYLVGSLRSTPGDLARAPATTVPQPPASPVSTSPAVPGPTAGGPAPAPDTTAAGTQVPPAQAGLRSAETSPPASVRPTAPAPPPSSELKGTLFVRSTPPGASVTVNGRTRGVTPVRIRDLAAGRYTIRVTRRGYETEERQVVISAARPSPALTFSLDRVIDAQPASRTEFFGTLWVESLPSGARVFVDGRLIGTTPLGNTRIAAGSHVVRVDRTGFRPWTSPIQIVTGQSHRVTASLERESR